MRRGLLLVVAVAALLGAAAVAIAAVSDPVGVKTSTAHEQGPAASVEWFAWTQRPFAHPGRANVFVEPTPIDGAGRFRVNLAGTRAWTGGIDGHTLVYQRIKNGQSGIRLFDLNSHADTGDADLNTRQWEWHPTISSGSTGRWVLFGRQNLGTGVQRVLATNLATGVTRTLGQVDRFRHAAIPGQVNGDLATWTLCKPRCNVRFVDLSIDPAAAPTILPRPTDVTHQYASSVTADGTVYFVESGDGCGKAVRIDRYDPGTGTTTPVRSLRSGRDIFFSYISDEAAGNHVYYDRVVCSTGRWNIYEIVETP